MKSNKNRGSEADEGWGVCGISESYLDGRPDGLDLRSAVSKEKDLETVKSMAGQQKGWDSNHCKPR